jgi:checkpoint serine/threonine-protein kinase
VTVNPKNGRSEHVFVNLEALYPTPEVPGTELCFEELMASHRGWLDKVWKSEAVQRPVTPEAAENSKEPIVSGDNLGREVSEKLVISRDPILLDENGATKEQNREGRGRRMKIKEVNETQISRIFPFYCFQYTYRQ